MSYCKVSINGQEPVPCEFRIDLERIDVTMETETVPDPSWEHVDAACHFHAWTTDGKVPTLTPRTEHRPCDGIHRYPISEPCEGYDVTLYSCTVCGEDVQPGTVTRRNVTKHLPGRELWTVVAYDYVAGDQPVSLVVHTDTGILFGFGRAVEAIVTSEPGQSRTTLAGISQLGRRAALAERVAA